MEAGLRRLGPVGERCAPLYRGLLISGVAIERGESMEPTLVRCHINSQQSCACLELGLRELRCRLRQNLQASYNARPIQSCRSDKINAKIAKCCHAAEPVG